MSPVTNDPVANIKEALKIPFPRLRAHILFFKDS